MTCSSKMRILSWCLLAGLLVGSQTLLAGDAGYVSLPVGFVRLSIASNQSVMMALPFDPFDGLLNSVFTNQLTGATDETNADRILYWDSETQQYVISYLLDGTGDAGRDRHWMVSGTTNDFSSQSVSVGDGFWIENRHGDQDVFLGGKVVLVSTQAMALVPGLNLISYPFSTVIGLNDSQLADQGAWGATNFAESDQIQNAEGDAYWLLDYPGHPDDGMWLNETGGVASLSLQPANSLWYTRVVSNSFLWSETRPYTDVFGSSSNVVRIVSFAAGTNQSSVSLDIECSGEAGETLDVLYKDLMPTDTFMGEEGWQVADSGLSTTGQTALTWVDSETITRPNVSSVFSRVYLVGRGDVDSDSDQLSDARETFVYQTCRNDSDTDDDGLDDYSELYVHWTQPREADTDQDAMSDGTEVYWGFVPTNQDAFATLPWMETFESLSEGALNGQSGWSADPIDVPIVQTNVVAQGLKALALPQYESNPLVRHFYGTEGHTQIWVKMSIRPVKGSLPEPCDATNRATAVVAVDGHGWLCGYNGVNQEWIVASNSPVSAGQWIPVLIALDYQTRTWKLYSGTAPLLAGLGFKDDTVREFSRAQWMGGLFAASYLDNIEITATEPLDLDDDEDGLPNYWERQYGIDIGDPSDALNDPDYDGLTSLEEYQIGTHPFLADSDGDGLTDGLEQLWGLYPVSSNEYQQVPWVTGFESVENYQSGDLNSQNGWSIQSGESFVRSNGAVYGQQYADMMATGNGAPARLLHFTVGSTGTVIWTGMKLQMVGEPLPIMTNVAGMTALVALNGKQQLAGYDGASGTWIVASNSMTVWPSVWAHLTVRRDYTTKSWSLYRDGIPVLKNLSFADTTVDRPQRILIEAGSTQGRGLDDLSISENKPSIVDEDADGLPDSVEDANGNGLVDTGETDPFDPDTDDDGMGDGNEAAWGFDPIQADSYTLLPWSADFESHEGYQRSLLHEQNGWLASSSVVVQAFDRAEGTNSVRFGGELGLEAGLTHFFGVQDHSLVWFEAALRVQPGSLPDPSLFTTSSVLVAINEDGILCGYDRSSASWMQAPTSFVIRPNQWVYLTFAVNYGTKTWDAYADSIGVFRDMPFANPGIPAFSRCRIALPAGHDEIREVYVDSVRIEIEEPDSLDADADGIPNTWERQFGLDLYDPLDAGLDPDRDRLTNLEEYRAGTSPFLFDTDGDGIEDGMEVIDMGSDPLSCDITGVQTSLSINARDAADLLGLWKTNGTAIFAQSRRGSLSYVFTVSSPDVYRIEVSGAAHNPIAWENDYELLLSIDDEYLGRYTLHTVGLSNSSIRALSPWLQEGPHSLTIYWDNSRERQSVQLNWIKLDTLLGLDANSNGMKDWVEARLYMQSGMDTPPDAFLVSPVCLEGRDPYLSKMTIPEAEIQPGAGNRWYANVPLSPTSSTPVTVSFQDGAVVAVTNLVWSPTDILQGRNLTIRKGDALLLTACPDGVVSGNMSIAIYDVTNYSATVDVPMPYTFGATGLYTIAGTFEGLFAASNTIQVSVVDGGFSTNPACWIKETREWECPQIPLCAVVEGDPDIYLEESTNTANGRVFNLRADEAETSYVVARVWENGPILDHARVDGFRLYSSTNTYLRQIQVYPDGSQLIEALLVMSPVLPSVTIRGEIFVSGVVFDDGMIVKDFPGSGFNELGECTISFIRPPAVGYSVCHWLLAYQFPAFLGIR